MVQSKYPSQSSNGLLELGTFTDETVVVKVDVRKNVIAKSFGVFGIKLDTLTKHMDNKTAVSLEQKRNTITGTVDAMGENQYLFLPIGYVNGFKATVNGEEAEIYQVFDTFMAIKLQNGTNTDVYKRQVYICNVSVQQRYDFNPRRRLCGEYGRK